MLNPWRQLDQTSKQDLISLQNKKLHAFINTYLYPFSPYYQKLFDDNRIDPQSIRTVQDLKRIPLTSKINLLPTEQNPAPYKDFILQPDKAKIKKHWPLGRLLSLQLQTAMKGEAYTQHELSKAFRPVFMTFTTGTTNKPVAFMYSQYDIENLYVSGARMLDLFAVKNDEHLINMFPYAPHLAFWQVVFGGIASCSLVLSTGGGKVMSTDGNIGAILKMNPSVIIGVPSYVYHVLREAKDKGLRMASVKKVVLGASKVEPGFKQKLNELLVSMGASGVSIFGTYGFTEARAAWAECPTSLDVSSGYHLYPDKEIFEIIDPETQEVKGEGEDGELVYTSLDSRCSSVLRYRTGDFVKGGITYEPCPYCKRRVPRLSSVITRLSDVKDLHLSKIKGALVNLGHFSEIMSSCPQVDEWQVELRKKNNDPYDVDEMVIYVSTTEGADQKELCDMIKRKMLEATEVTPNAIQFIPRPEMVKRLEIETANKEKRILDTRPKG
jgi:phenylacetate-CoA ligase